MYLYGYGFQEMTLRIPFSYPLSILPFAGAKVFCHPDSYSCGRAERSGERILCSHSPASPLFNVGCEPGPRPAAPPNIEEGGSGGKGNSNTDDWIARSNLMFYTLVLLSGCGHSGSKPIAGQVAFAHYSRPRTVPVQSPYSHRTVTVQSPLENTTVPVHLITTN